MKGWIARSVTLRSKNARIFVVTKTLPAPACLYAGPIIFIMLMCIYLITACFLLVAASVLINQFNPIEVPSDSLLQSSVIQCPRVERV